MAEAGAAQDRAQAVTRAKLIEEKALVFAKDGMIPPAHSVAELFAMMDPCAELVQELGMYPEVGAEVMYRTLAGLDVDSVDPMSVSAVVVFVMRALKRAAKDQADAVGPDGTGMATDEERTQALQSAFTEPTRVLQILTAAGAADYERAAAAVKPVTKPSGNKSVSKSIAAAESDVDMTEHDNETGIPCCLFWNSQ